MTESKLVYIGKIISLDPIPDADNIVLATVICGAGGKWRGVVRKKDFAVGNLCIVYLPDAIIPESDHMQFMKHSNWRVIMRRFRGAPSEVVIMALNGAGVLPATFDVGVDITNIMGVKKYIKFIPVQMAGLMKGEFPSFIPKTDEPNYQSNPDLVESLIGQPYYITEKLDGTSTTVYRYNGEFGVCSRYVELLDDDKNIFWKMAKKYDLQTMLVDNHAIQFETCGPNIQKNPKKFKVHCGLVFNVFNIEEKRYLPFMEMMFFCGIHGFPTVEVLEEGSFFRPEIIEYYAQGKYTKEKSEGVVIRSKNLVDHGMTSFKVINLNYE